MKRRSVLYSLLGVTLLPNEAAWGQALEGLKIPSSVGEAVALGRPKFFNPADLALFTQLGDWLVPAWEGRPGAKEARAAEFLDFLLSQSPADLQQLYRDGMAVLRLKAKAKPEEILAPLREAYSYAGPKDRFAKFLQAAKMAFFQATVNSREYAEAMSQRSRGAAGIGSYWLPTE
jgi:hypothetical protein